VIMLDNDGIANLFFSLASKSRLDLLHTLTVDKLRMNEVAQKIDITATEASRQIKRLLDELIIQKQPDGAYVITNYGKLVLHFLPTFEFIFKHKQYFLVHDVWQLPPQFISRLGELSQGSLCTELAETVNRVEKMIQSSNDYVWVITDQVMSVHSNVMTERISKGVTFRSLIHKRLVKSSQINLFGKNVERRILSSIPGVVVITEKEAAIGLLTVDGKLSHSGFFGTDPSFMKWVTDFFIYYWEKAKRGYTKVM